MRYFLLKDDIDLPGRWFLGPFSARQPINFWRFLDVGPVKETYADLSIAIRGSIVLDFTFSDFEIPIINDKAASCLPDNEILLLNLKIGSFNNFYILMLLNELACVDEEASDFIKFDNTHPVRPDLAGSYEVIYKLIIDKDKCNGHSIFRVKGYSQYIIVDEKIKTELEKTAIRGIAFLEV